jgi:hypothetical protein
LIQRNFAGPRIGQASRGSQLPRLCAISRINARTQAASRLKKTAAFLPEIAINGSPDSTRSHQGFLRQAGLPASGRASCFRQGFLLQG